MEYDKVVKELYTIESKKGSKLGLENIKELLKKIGSPEKNLKVIHVAGTNGKGSVCSMVSSILKEAGYKVGLYTSPHLISFRERFRINNQNISEKDIIRYYLKVKKHITNQTFFEVITAIAFLYFKEKKIHYLVLEVGLGGRLDATNVIIPLISIITNIDIEHTDYLGKTIEKIAYEKAGIIKKNVPVVTGAEEKALKKIKEICKKRNSKLYLPKKYKKNNGTFEINNYRNLKLNLKGDFQLSNSAIALSALEILKKEYKLKINNSNIKKGLNNVKWKGRFEFIKKNTIIDCAHNPAALKTLSKELERIKNRFDSTILVIGILKDKDIKKIIKIIEPLADKIIITKPKVPRAEDPKKIKKYVKKDCKIINDVKKAVKFTQKTTNKEDLVLVTGSSYVIGELLKK